MVTNLFIRMPSCLSFKGRNYRYGHFFRKEMVDSPMAVPDAATDGDDGDGGGGTGAGGFGGGGGGGGGSVIVTVRTFFPETWLWDMFETG